MNRGQASDRIIKAALPMGPKLVLLVYLMHQSSKDSPETGVSWPGLPALALHLQMSRSFVIEARKALVDARILVADGSGKGESPRYRIDFARIPVPTEEECAAYKDNIREHRSPKGVQRVHPRGPAPTPPGVQDVHPQGSSVDTPRGPDGTPQGSSPYTRTVSKEPPVGEPSPGNHHQENRPQGTGGAEVSATVTDSPPPAEPSGSPADLWSKAADLADPEAWRASEEFQPSTNAYVFDDAEPVGVIEEPSVPRQIESPDHDSFDPASMVLPRTVGANPQRYTLHAVKADAKATPDVASTSPAQPFDPIEEFTPSPPPSASPAARPRGLSGEGAPGGATSPQSAPSLFGRTNTAPEAQTPAKAPPRARKATAADKAADALAVYGAWRVYHPRAAETPTPGTLRALGSLLTEAGSREDALLLIEWAHVGTCERARQIQGVAPWPDRRLKALWDLESLSRHVAGRLEMARSWKEGSTDKDSGLNVINLPPPSYRAPPNRTTRDIDFYKALELI